MLQPANTTQHLTTNSSISILKTAIRQNRPQCTDIAPNLKHFIYKSRPNVQFTMPSFTSFPTLVSRRRLISLYSSLHASIHARTAHLKVHHCVAKDAVALAWETQAFELYCVAGPGTSREVVAREASRVVKWVRREEERVFIIGGAVF